MRSKMFHFARLLHVHFLLTATIALALATSDVPRTATNEHPLLLEESIGTFSVKDEALFGFAAARSPPSAATCKTFPTDATWPAEEDWSRLNATLNGALVKTVPIAAPCYPGPAFDQARCATIAAQWGTSDLQYVLFLSS